MKFNKVIINLKYVKKTLKIIGLVLSILALLFSMSEHYGVWDRLRGTNYLLDVYARLETSYADVDRIIYPYDPAWKPLLHLIYRYSSADFPKEREPKCIGRGQATAAFKQDLGKGKMTEWTAPSTPFVILYKEWPVVGAVNPEDYRIVGSIGDLKNWIQQDKNEFNFKIHNIFFGVLSIAVACLLI
ncbi:MAG: hypothetical protein WCW77_02945 [Patescibacteria group bacterium]|jgi:hypothetical protein